MGCLIRSGVLTTSARATKGAEGRAAATPATIAEFKNLRRFGLPVTRLVWFNVFHLLANMAECSADL